MAEPESELVREAMSDADGWYICRPGFVEVVRAVGLAAGERATKAVKDEWPAFVVIEADQALTERAASLALAHGLRNLDAIHLAAALLVAGEEFALATWDGACATPHGPRGSSGFRQLSTEGALDGVRGRRRVEPYVERSHG